MQTRIRTANQNKAMIANRIFSKRGRGPTASALVHAGLSADNTLGMSFANYMAAGKPAAGRLTPSTTLSQNKAKISSKHPTAAAMLHAFGTTSGPNTFGTSFDDHMAAGKGPKGGR